MPDTPPKFGLIFFCTGTGDGTKNTFTLHYIFSFIVLYSTAKLLLFETVTTHFVKKILF